LSLLRSYTLDGAKDSIKTTEGEDGPVRCAVKEKYPFSAAAGITEDDIVEEPEKVKKIIVDHTLKMEQSNKQSEAP